MVTGESDWIDAGVVDADGAPIVSRSVYPDTETVHPIESEKGDAGLPRDSWHLEPIDGADHGVHNVELIAVRK